MGRRKYIYLCNIYILLYTIGIEPEDDVNKDKQNHSDTITYIDLMMTAQGFSDSIIAFLLRCSFLTIQVKLRTQKPEF